MDLDRVNSLKQAISELWARDDSTQLKLNVFIDRITHLSRPTSPPAILTHIPDTEIVPPSHSPLPARGPPPALPSEFDGDRSRGQEFLCSCQTYIRLCSHNFPDDQISITWTLSYMKSGRAAEWPARVSVGKNKTESPASETGMHSETNSFPNFVRHTPISPLSTVSNPLPTSKRNGP